LFSSITFIFHARGHFFNRFSRWIACSTPFEAFEIHQPIDAVLLRKPFSEFRLVLRDAANEIIGHADVERAADSAG
jgi:hypothetical protein